MQTKISVTILAKNAQRTLKECLQKLADFDEVILLDNQSTDLTLKIAQEFDNVRVFESEFIGFGPLKNLAISYAKNDWILSLDSDEVLEDALLEEIKQTNFQRGHYYSFLRKNYYRGEWIKGCGWHPDWVKRIFNKNEVHFAEDLVHEGLKISQDLIEVKLKKGGIKHYSFESIAHLLEKLQMYSTLWAKQNPNKRTSVSTAIIRGLWTFLRNYLFKKGFLYGYKGFVISVCNGLGAFFKYMKLYENQQSTPKLSLIVTTYNQPQRLALVLDSIRNQKMLPFEVLIADDGSVEETRELIKSYQNIFPVSLRHIWQEDQGYRLARSRNQAILESKGDYLVVIDGDMILSPYFVADHLRFATKKTFIQGGRILLNENETHLILQKQDFKLAFEKRSLKSHRCRFLSKLIFLFSRQDRRAIKEERILCVRGCNMAFFKEDVLAINGFDEDFVGWGREDSEFVVRFLNNQGQMRKLKFSAIAYHIHHQENSKKMLDKNHQLYLDSIKQNKTWCQSGIIS